MPYAVFTNGQKMSRDYPTEDECWTHAEEAGLVDIVEGKKVLDDDFAIQPCAGDKAHPPAVASDKDDASASR